MTEATRDLMSVLTCVVLIVDTIAIGVAYLRERGVRVQRTRDAARRSSGDEVGDMIDPHGQVDVDLTDRLHEIQTRRFAPTMVRTERKFQNR